MERVRLLARGALGLVLLGLVLGLAWSNPAAGEPDPDADEGSTFQWDDPKMKEAFTACMEMVDWVVHGRRGDKPHPDIVWPWQDAPGGIDEDLWRRAVHGNMIYSFETEEFPYRPRCDMLLPEQWEVQVPYRYYSDVFTRCMEVVGGDTSKKRPKVVPAWYWEVSKKIGDCYLLLPLGAFGLGPDENAWSTWTVDQEPRDPNPDSAPPPLREEYRICLEYIDWRMENGAAFWGGTGDVYDDPPRGASPPRVWHEALDFFVDPTKTGRSDDTTLPADWNPNCERLLTSDICQPSGPSNPSLLPESCIGPHSSNSYDIGWSQYDDPNEEDDPSIVRNIWGATTQYAFLIGRGGVQVAIWAVDWAYNFDVTKYNGLALDIGDDYDNFLVGHPQFRLRDLFWLILIGWAAYTALRGRFASAGSEFLVTIVLLLVAGFLLTNREMYMNATWRLMSEGETTLLVAGMGRDPQDADSSNRTELIRELQKSIHFAFVEEPYDYLNWGRSLGKPDDPNNPLRNCAAAREYILGEGPHGADRWPRQQMAAAGDECKPLVEFNRNPDGTRLLGAILVMLSSLAVGIMLIIVGLTVVVAKVIAVLLFAVVPFAALVAILPGHGRKLTWSWATTLMQVVIVVLGMSFVLSLLLLTLRALIGVTTDVDLIERFALMDIVVAIMFGVRRSLLRSSQRFAARLSEFLASPRGTGASWASAAASAGPGLDLLSIDRGLVSGVAYPVGATVLLRMQERRVARRSYRNLERVAVWKRARNSTNRRWAERNAGNRRWGVGPPMNPDQPWTLPLHRQPLP